MIYCYFDRLCILLIDDRTFAIATNQGFLVKYWDM